MAALTNNKYDIFEWIKSVINSCETFPQAYYCESLINSFYKMHNDAHLDNELMSILGMKKKSI